MRPSRTTRADRGQILALFALSLVAIVAMAALLFDGADALLTRRKLQNAGDAAALAGANVIQAAGSNRGCSLTAAPPGAPRGDIVTAALASVDTNMPGFDHANIVVTCPVEWENQAVRVELNGAGSRFFSASILGSPIRVATKSTGINGHMVGTIFSVVLLDPANPSWPNGRRGCPSLLLSGGPSVTFDGSVQVNSACPGGALATNGNAATLAMAAGQVISLVGGYSPAALTINPPPLTGQATIPDPLAGVPDVSTAGATLCPLIPAPVPTLCVRSATRLVLSNQTAVLEPGIYRGGIELRNSSRAILQPGIYVLDGGGLSLGAQSEFYSVAAGVTSVDSATWSQNCPDETCGVLIYNTGTDTGSNAMGPVGVTAGATLKLKAYDDRAMANEFPEYRNILFFQSRTPAPKGAPGAYEQPAMTLRGGGNVDISGTVYAPGALVDMGGSSGGSGGGNVSLTLQFISWDLRISGNVSFRFFYQSNEFARPTQYGLVE